MSNNFPRLVADIGGTNARFSLEISPFNYEKTRVLPCKDYLDLSDAVQAYFAIEKIERIEHAAFAMPCPISGDTILMVNSPWKMTSISQTKQKLGLANIVFLNDFHALALAIPHIPQDKLVHCGGNAPDTARPIGIIGPGTGLGVASLIRHPTGEYIAIPAEGGHSSFTPVSREEVELWDFAQKRFQHVSFERFVSGPGLQLIYEAVCSVKKVPITTMPTPAEINSRAMNNECWLCQLTLDHFCRMLGTACSNLATMVNAFGGIYIGGGVVPRVLPYFLKSDFRCRFEDKGRLRQHLEKIPVYVITHEFPAFLGVSYALDIYIKKGYLP